MKLRKVEGGGRMAITIGNMRASGLIAGIIFVVIGALMLADAVVTMSGNTAFMFVENMNRGFEFVVGFVAVILGAIVMDFSRNK